VDALKEEIGILKEEYKSLFLLLVADLTGSFTSFYQVLIGKVPIYILYLSGLGFIGAFFITVLIFRLKHKMNKLIKQMKE